MAGNAHIHTANAVVVLVTDGCPNFPFLGPHRAGELQPRSASGKIAEHLIVVTGLQADDLINDIINLGEEVDTVQG